MRVADVFADKPPNGANGIPGSMSSITCE